MSLVDRDPKDVLDQLVLLLIRLVFLLLLVLVFAYGGLQIAYDLYESYLAVAPDYFLSTVTVPAYIAHLVDPGDPNSDLRYWANKFGRAQVLEAGALLGAYLAIVLGISLTLKRGRIVHTLRWILIVLTTTLVGGLLGSAVGYLLGANVPDYYRGVFPAGKETWFNPTQVGIGLGASQGLAGGVVVGGFLVLADAWLLSRRMIHSVADRS